MTTSTTVPCAETIRGNAIMNLPIPTSRILEVVSWNSGSVHKGMTIYKNHRIPFNTRPDLGDNTQAALAYVFGTWYMHGQWPDF